MNYIEIVSAAIGGGLIKSVIDYVNSSKSARKDELTEVVRVWQEDNARLRKENDILRADLSEIQKDLADLKTKVILLESTHTDAPLPMWLKDISGRMLAINQEYEKCFLQPKGLSAMDYIGKFDEDVWSLEQAAEYKRNDTLALLDDVWKGKETIIINGEPQEWIIIKYVRYAGKAKVGIAGLAIPPNFN